MLDTWGTILLPNYAPLCTLFFQHCLVSKLHFDLPKLHLLLFFNLLSFTSTKNCCLACPTCTPCFASHQPLKGNEPIWRPYREPRWKGVEHLLISFVSWISFSTFFDTKYYSCIHVLRKLFIMDQDNKTKNMEPLVVPWHPSSPQIPKLCTSIVSKFQNFPQFQKTIFFSEYSPSLNSVSFFFVHPPQRREQGYILHWWSFKT
jgi:hypothetical protein